MSKVKSKMRIGLKRILSVFLTLMLVQTAVPFTSFAESVANSATSEPAVLELDENTSENLQNKIRKANDGDIIQINSAVDMNETVTINKSITLKGSGSLLRKHTDGPIIKIESVGKLTIKEVTINGNELSNESAAIELSENSEFTMKSGKIINNYGGEHGGGIYNNQGTVIISKDTITSDDGLVTISDGTITGNTAKYGGGIYNQGTLTIGSGTIKKNTAKYGGGIYNTKTLTISGGTITENIASINDNSDVAGGGIYNQGTLTMSNGIIRKNTVSGPNTNYVYGGGVYNTGALTISDGTITGNTATNGGGIFNDRYTVTINGGTITGNTATNGGGIYNSFGTITMSKETVTISNEATIIKKGVITENTASYSGGGIYNQGTLTISGGTIKKNIADCGGGISNDIGTVTMNEEPTTANDGTVTTSKVTIAGNTATVGGGIYNNQKTVTINGGIITENTATMHGGGIFNNSRGNLTVNGGTIAENTAESDGGGIHNQGSLTVRGGTITGNTAKSDGGGINNNLIGATVIISGETVITKNTATNGGGIFSGGDIYNYNALTLNGGTVTGNSATSGGGIFNTSTVTISSETTITGNTATNGGGIFNDTKGNAAINDKTIITGNTAYDNGGGIFNDTEGIVTINDGTITGNTAYDNGGGIFSAGLLTMNGGTISNNQKCGIYICGGTDSFKVKGSAKVIDNGADRHNNVTLTSEDNYITITGEFTGSIKIKSNSFNRAVVKPIMLYNITQNDLSHFEADDDNAYLSLIDNEIIYMENKTGWGQIVQNNGVTYYVDEDGKASAEVGGKGKIWLNTKTDESGSWYCIDNSNGLFRTGSRFYVQVIDDISKYYDKIGSEYRDKIEDGKLKIFLIGVIDPDGNEYTTLNSDLTCYVKIDPNWDTDKLRAIFINGDMTEKIDIDYLSIMDGPSNENKFAKLVIKHFSPYAIYQTKSNDIEVTQIETNTNNISDTSLTNSIATGENFNYIYILGLFASSIIALSSILILKRKFNK